MPSETTAYPVTVAALMAKIPDTVVLDAVAREFFGGSIHDADAIDEGTHVESATVLDEVLRVVDRALPSILASVITGYGPMRLRYVLELAADLAGKVDTLDNGMITAAGAGAAKTTTLHGTRTLRRDAVRVLKSLAGRRPEENARLERARRGQERPDERARSLDALAAELEASIERVPESVARDAGASPELVAALRTNAGAVLATRADAQGSRGAVGSIYDEMNLLDGKIIHELRLLVGAMRDARKKDPSVPAVRSKLVASGAKKKKAAPAAPNG